MLQVPKPVRTFLAGLIVVMLFGLAPLDVRGGAPLEIKIGFIGPVTGFSAVHGNNMQKAAELAVDRANAEGGVTIGGQKYRVRLIVADEEGTVAERAVSATQRLIEQEQVLAIVGYVFSSNVLAVIPLAQRARTPVINTVGAALTIPQNIARDKMDFIFSVSLTTEEWAVAMAGALGRHVKPKKVAVLQLNTDSARVLERGLRTHLPNAVPGVEMEFLYKEPDQADFNPELLKIRQFGADAIIFHHSGTPSYAFVDQLYDSGLAQKAVVLGTGDYSTQEFLDKTAPKTDLHLSQVITFKAPITPVTIPFYVAYEKLARKVAPYQAIQQYDGMLMMLEGLRRMNAPTGGLVRDRQALREALDTITQQRPVTAIRGRLYFLPLEQGHRAVAPSAVVQVQGNQNVMMWPPEGVTGKFIDPRK